MSIRSAAKAIIIKEGKVLINKYRDFENKVYYDFPGGGQEQYETMEEAVIRECLEETGYRVRVLRCVALAEEIHESQRIRRDYPEYAHCIHHMFLCELVSDIKEEATEIDFQQEKILWMPVEEVGDVRLRLPQLQKGFLDVVNSEHPHYLGSAYIQGF